jgi:hypothetical protein
MQWDATRATSDVSLLEASVERARLALGCAFSSSDEFEADLIAERRAAGAYGPTPHQRRAAWAGLAAAFLLVAFLFG